MHGGVWEYIPIRCVHPRVLECYAIFQGSSQLLLGCGQNDETEGIEVAVGEGDMKVLPTGTAHPCPKTGNEPECRYIRVYPEVSRVSWVRARTKI